MDSLVLAYSFVAAVAIAAGVVALFSRSMDAALSRVIPSELAAAWCQYVKFALFTVTFAGGMRLTELAQFLMMRAPAGPPPSAGQDLIEVLKTIAGALIAASAALLVFFAATLAVYASMRVYQSSRLAAPSARPPAGADRHSGAKDRARVDDSGRVS